jgi:hypothetical protein
LLISGALAATLYARPAGAVTFGTGKTGSATGGGTSLAPSWSAATTSGNLLVAVVGVKSSTVTVTPMDSTWQQAVTPKVGTNVTVYVYYIAGSGARSGSETFNLSGSANATAQLVEFTGGLDPGSPLDTSAFDVSTSPSDPADASSMTTKYSNEIVFAAFAMDDNKGFATPTGYTSINDAKVNGPPATNFETLIAYQFTTSAGTFAPTSAIGASLDWVGVQVGFHGTTRHWAGGSTTCSSGTWKDELGNAASAPNSSSVVFFDSTSSTSCSQGAVTWNELHVQSTYTGTLTATGTITTNAGISIAGGIVNGPLSTGTSFSLTGGAYNVTSTGGPTFTGAGTIGGGVFTGLSGKTATFSSTLEVSGGTLDLSAGILAVTGDTTVDGGTLNVHGGTATLSGNLTVSSGTLDVHGGTATLSATSAVLTVSGGTLDVNAGTLSTTGTTSTAVISGGTLDADGGTVTLKGTTVSGGNLKSTKVGAGGSVQVSTLAVSGGLADTAGGTITVTGATSSTGGTLQAGTAGTLNLQSTLTVNGSGAVVDAHSGTITVTSTTTVTLGTLEASTAGGVTLNAGLTVNGGTVDAASGTITANSTTSLSSGTIEASSAGNVILKSTITFSGGTIDAATGTIDTTAVAVTVNGTTCAFNGTNGTVKLSTLTVKSGTFDGAGGSVTANGAVLVNGGTYKVGSGTSLMTGGITVSSGTLDMSSDGGQLQIGNGSSAQTLLLSGGTLQTTGTTQSTYPKITWGSSATANYAFSVTSGTININGLQVQHADANGMNVSGTSVTLTSLKNVRFSNNAGGTSSQHLLIARNKTAMTLYAPGCGFDSSVKYNVVTTGTTNLMTFVFDLASPLGYEGDAHDLDGDKSPTDGIPDNTGSNSTVVLWTSAAASDTAGVAAGFPTAAIDWNTFTFYSVYVAFTGVSAGTDQIYVRNVSTGATAGYNYPIDTATYGTIVGTPRWDTINETGTLDVNGNGVLGETSVHVLYVTTTKAIIKLIDNGTSLSLPGTNNPWNTPFPAAGVASITGSTPVYSIASPVTSDSANLYFAGTDSAGKSQMFGVQIASGGTTCNGTSNSLSSEEKCAKQFSVGTTTTMNTAPSWEAYNSNTYLFFASTSTIYQYDVTTSTNTSPAYTNGGTLGTINGSVRVAFGSLWASDSKGNLHRVNAIPGGSGSFATVGTFPYNPSGKALSAPYIDGASSTVHAYVGDSTGALFKVDASKTQNWTLSSGIGAINTAPLYLSANGYLIVGDTAGKVAYIDTSIPKVTYTLTLSSGNAISAISYDPSGNGGAGAVMVSTGGGQLFYLPKSLP